MKPTIRNLSIRMKGEDVRLLQKKLNQLGFSIEDKDGFFGKTTRRAVLDIQKKHGMEATGIVDERTARFIAEELEGRKPEGEEGSKPFVVRGQIRAADGSPIAGVIVQAIDKDLRHEEKLGTTETDKEGHYEITYTAGQFHRAEKKSADLIVRVFDEKESLLVASHVKFNAQPEEVIDLEVSREKISVRSEYERIIEEISTLLGDKHIADLREDDEDKPEAGKFKDISFLSGETGISALYLSFLVQAVKLSLQTKIDPEIFYGLFRQNLPTELPTLLAQEIETHRLSLKKSMSSNIIPSHFEDKLEKILKVLHDLQGEILFRKPVFLVKPEVFYNNLTDLKIFDPEESNFIGMRLNEHFRNELLKSIGTVSEAMNKSLRTALSRLDYRDFQDSEPKIVLLETILPEIIKDSTLEQETSEIKIRISSIPLQKISNLLHLDVPTKDNPILYSDIRKARTLSYARLAKLSDKTTVQLMEKNLYLDDADETMLSDLVSKKIINTRQKEDLKLTIDLGRLTDDNMPFIKSLKTSEITSISDMVSWEKDDWQRNITKDNIPLPPGETLDSYAENIALNIEKTYPSHKLMSRLLDPKEIARIDRLDSLNYLLGSHDKLIDGKNPANIDWETITTEKRDELQKDLQDMVAFTNTYRHLDIAEVINDRNCALDKKKEMIKERLQLLDTFCRNNPKFDLRFVNFFEKNTGLNWQNISEEDRPRVRRQLMAYQRSLNMAEESSDRQMLLGKGYDSQVGIAHKTEAHFIKTSGLQTGKARMIYANALESSLQAAHSYAGMRDALWGNFDDINLANNISPELLNDLRDIDGFEVLFGPQNFCACEECKSILSPAAYFVDLMHFIEQYVSKPVFIEKNLTDHPLYLKNRRGDLWKLNLTCENTSTLVPHLTIVNEVLEEYLKKVVNGDIFKRLSRRYENISFALPFNLPLEELRIYLSHFGITVHELYRTLKQPDQKIWRAKLNLSEDEYWVINTPRINDVKKRFGKTAAFTNLNVQEFIGRAGITRNQLDELLALNFNPDLQYIKVEKQMSSDEFQNFEEILQNLTDRRLDFIHRFIHLWKKTGWTIPELDLVLCALKDAELIRLTSISSVNTLLYEEAVQYIAKLRHLQDTLKLTVEELCTMVHQIPASDAFPMSPTKESDKMLLEKLFDVQKLFYLFSWDEITSNTDSPADKTLLRFLKGKYNISWVKDATIQKIDNDKTIRVSAGTNFLTLSRNNEKTKVNLKIDDNRTDEIIANLKNSKLNIYDTSIPFHHYSLNKKDIEDQEIDIKTPILLGGLGVSETELLLLFELLQEEMPFDLDGDTILNKEKISLLFRHARLAKALKLSVNELIHALYLNLLQDDLPINTLEKIQHIQEFRNWLKSSPFNVYELCFILKGAESSQVKYKMNSEAIVELVKDIQKPNNLLFGKDVLDKIEKINKDDSKKIVEQMEKDGLIIASGNSYSINPTNYRLTQDFSTIFSASGVNSEVIAKELEIREKLNEFHPFVTSFTAITNIGKELYHQLVKFVSVDMGSDDFVKALQVTFDDDGKPVPPDDLDILLKLSTEFELQISLFEKLKFESRTVKFIAENKDVLGIANIKKLTIDDIKAMVLYKKLITQNQETELSMQEVLGNYKANSPFTDDATKLSDLWQVDTSLIDSLIKKSLTLPDVPIQALSYLKEVLDICQMLGINGFSMQKLIDDRDFKKLSTARDIALGAFSSKYEDEKVRKEKLEPYQDRINVIKRDALCDYIIAREIDLKFEDMNEIYAFFLLDVEMSGCFRTSRLVCGISSLQLYIHRVLINLEQSASDGLNVLNSIEDPIEFRFEWEEWRKNYRVWEANRKVFLYPENYLEPDLRDNKTPIFKELEDELLQQKITKESAEAAYKKYISQFAELARLRIAGNYYHQESNTYYFFGCTQQDPPQYYYRTWDKKIWMPWKKIELGINSNSVSAVIHLGKLYLFWVDIKTKEETQIENGTSASLGFKVDIDILYSFLNENGRWLPAQRLEVWKSPFLLTKDYKEYYENKKYYKHAYTRPYEGVLYVYALTEEGTLCGGRLNLFSNSIYLEQYLFMDAYDKIWFLPGDFRPLVLYKDSTRSAFVESFTNHYREPFMESFDIVKREAIPDKTDTNIFDQNVFCPDLDLVRNKPGDQIFTIGNQQYLTNRAKHGFHTRSTIRLTTSLIDELGEKLFTEGLEAFLSLKTQEEKIEHPIGIEFDLYSLWLPPLDDPKHINFLGAYGEYYRELFFHIPFLIANHLNANQKFKEAKWWYERIYDPTASESPEEEKPDNHDRVWRYIEFRDWTVPKMKEILTQKAAIEQYKTDPFNPHAIARLRLSAYQKGIVMKYIDNLLDWGDYLFAQNTMESINEATMLYVLASDILGKRPVQVGKCETVKDTQLTYENIGPSIDQEADILINLENFNWYTYIASLLSNLQLAAESDSVSSAPGFFTSLSTSLETADDPGLATSAASLPGNTTRFEITPQYRTRSYLEIVEEKDIYRGDVSKLDVAGPSFRNPALEVAEQSTLVFCVPPNQDLLDYWDRVEDRLFKIRNCMNISGVRQQLALFQPPINPMALVRAKAAGLSLEDILSMLAAQLPPYRFSYLIEKAKQYTQTVQAFGSALLSALEKKDVEELTLLRSVHERNILQMTKEIKKQQLQEAQYQCQVIVETKTNVQNRIDYYQGLIEGGLTGWEITQQVSKHTSTVTKIISNTFFGAAPILYLIPQLGSPFAIKYGGKEMGDSAKAWGEFLDKISLMAEAISESAGLEATFQRREQEWNQQLLLAQQEFKQVEKQLLAADIRQLIAEKDLEIHEKNMDQADELHDFYKNKFTNLGLYNYLSTSLNRLYREAYNMAYDMAKMAEKTYQFERDDDKIFIAGDNWQFDRAGLLAGERLLLQLQQMERAYIEQNKRDFEVTQSFSMALLNPSALLELKENGSCNFKIPEIAFDIFYPGQYKRLIKSVRVTIPCVTGPYTNISATLTLNNSWIRKEAKDPDVEPQLMPSQSGSIATSSAQNDGGLFELNFRDERYLPFEGTGAISTWGLELPDQLRLFNYDTISDVIMHMSYTARYDGGLFRDKVEKKITDELSKYAADNGSLLSMKHDFPDAFYILLNPSGTTQTTNFELTKQHFPHFLVNKNLILSEVKIYLKLKDKEAITPTGPALKINNLPPIINWTDISPDLKEGIISISGNPIMKWTIDAGIGGLNEEKIDDILFLLKYTIS